MVQSHNGPLHENNSIICNYVDESHKYKVKQKKLDNKKTKTNQILKKTLHTVRFYLCVIQKQSKLLCNVRYHGGG